MGSLGCRCRVRRARQVRRGPSGVCTAPVVKRAGLCLGDPRAPCSSFAVERAADRSRALSLGRRSEPLLPLPIPRTSLASRMEMRDTIPRAPRCASTFPVLAHPFWVANPSASHPRSPSLARVYFSKVVCTQFERGGEAAKQSLSRTRCPRRENWSLGTDLFPG